MHPDLPSSLAQIVAFRTVPGNDHAKNECLDWIAYAFLAKSGLRIERGDAADSPYLYMRHPNPKLLWFAHADVVPGNDAQFTLAFDGDIARGRGVKDMKGAALTFLLAYRDCVARGIVPPVSVLVTTDEEVGGKSLVALHDRRIFENVPVAFTPDTSEHPGIVTELKGAVWARLTCRGKGAHGATPWFGDNPVPMLASVLARIGEAFPPGGPDDWRMTVTPTQLTGSDAFNTIPDEAHCTLDIRYPASACASTGEAIAKVAMLLPSSCTLTTMVTADALSTDAKHPMVQRIKHLAEEILGEAVAFHREHGSSDAREFGSRGIPAFLYGPKGGDLHGISEWVSISSLDQHIKLNRLLLEELASE